jgi:hypothetical protein
MKRLNYFQVHKNKKPKKLKNKKVNKLGLNVLLIGMHSFVQHEIIVSQQFKNISEKQLAILNNVKNTANAIQKIFNEQKKIKYLQRVN